MAGRFMSLPMLGAFELDLQFYILNYLVNLDNKQHNRATFLGNLKRSTRGQVPCLCLAYPDRCTSLRLETLCLLETQTQIYLSVDDSCEKCSFPIMSCTNLAT